MEPIAAVLRNPHIPACRGGRSCPQLGRTSETSSGKRFCPAAGETGFAFSQESHSALNPLTFLTQGWITQRCVFMPFSGQLGRTRRLRVGLSHARIRPSGKEHLQGVLELHQGEKAGSRSLSAIGSAKRQIFYCLVHCLQSFLSSSAHFPRPRDRIEPLLLQSPISMGQDFTLCQGCCAANPAHLYFYSLLEDRSQSSQLVSVTDPARQCFNLCHFQ